MGIMWIETIKGELVNLEHVETIIIKAADDNALMRIEARTTSGSQIVIITASDIRDAVKKHLFEEHTLHSILEDVYDNLIKLIDSGDAKVIRAHICAGDVCEV
jgi:hypothetical protein